jgi:hypothetical protein
MQLANLRNGDVFKHHNYGVSTVISGQKGAKLCKSESNASFLEADEYDAEILEYAAASIQQVTQFFDGVSADDFIAVNEAVKNALQRLENDLNEIRENDARRLF